MPPMLCESRQECVGRGIIPLGRGSHEGRNGGEQNEMIQIKLSSCEMEVPSASHLRSQNSLESVPGHVADEAVIQDAGSMEDASDRIPQFGHQQHGLFNVDLVPQFDPVKAGAFL